MFQLDHMFKCIPNMHVLLAKNAYLFLKQYLAYCTVIYCRVEAYSILAKHNSNTEY